MSHDDGGPHLVPPPRKRVAAALHIPHVVPPRHDPIVQPKASFRTPREYCADTEKKTLKVRWLLH